MTTHKDLKAWQIGIQVVTKVFEITKQFPFEERTIFMPQMCRSALSIPSNIAEGAARKSVKEQLRFLNIALASIAELETQVIVCQKLKLINNQDLLNIVIENGKTLSGYIKFIQRRWQVK